MKLVGLRAEDFATLLATHRLLDGNHLHLRRLVDLRRLVTEVLRVRSVHNHRIRGRSLAAGVEGSGGRAAGKAGLRHCHPDRLLRGTKNERPAHLGTLRRLFGFRVFGGVTLRHGFVSLDVVSLDVVSFPETPKSTKI